MKCNIWKLGCTKFKILFPNILTTALLKLLQIHGLTHSQVFCSQFWGPAVWSVFSWVSWFCLPHSQLQLLGMLISGTSLTGLGLAPVIDGGLSLHMVSHPHGPVQAFPLGGPRDPTEGEFSWGPFLSILPSKVQGKPKFKEVKKWSPSLDRKRCKVTLHRSVHTREECVATSFFPICYTNHSSKFRYNAEKD